jgi:hypothetical protein
LFPSLLSSSSLPSAFSSYFSPFSSHPPTVSILPLFPYIFSSLHITYNNIFMYASTMLAYTTVSLCVILYFA